MSQKTRNKAVKTALPDSVQDGDSSASQSENQTPTAVAASAVKSGPLTKAKKAGSVPAKKKSAAKKSAIAKPLKIVKPIEESEKIPFSEVGTEINEKLPPPVLKPSTPVLKVRNRSPLPMPTESVRVIDSFGDSQNHHDIYDNTDE